MSKEKSIQNNENNDLEEEYLQMLKELKERDNR